jgi:hypothetical protein
MAFAKNDAVMRASPGSAVFALHGLFLVMSSAFGPSRWVELVLETALECMLRPTSLDVGLRPAAAAVVTAIVEVQGPEFCPTSKTHPVAECVPHTVLWGYLKLIVGVLSTECGGPLVLSHHTQTRASCLTQECF